MIKMIMNMIIKKKIMWMIMIMIKKNYNDNGTQDNDHNCNNDSDYNNNHENGDNINNNDDNYAIDLMNYENNNLMTPFQTFQHSPSTPVCQEQVLDEPHRIDISHWGPRGDA